MKKILLVDDDQGLCEFLCSYLVSFNFYVSFVYDVPNALAHLKQNDPDLVISDIMMDDLDGYDFIKLLKLDRLLIHIPVIFLTAKGMTNDRIKGYDLGCHAYLIKPFNPQELVALINSIFNHINVMNRQVLFKNRYCPKDLQRFDFLNFTNREKCILSLVLKGYMNKEIAISLNIGQRNVEQYVSRLLYKTNTRNRVELLSLFISEY
uniref:TctD transcriptional regulator n=1 Tax=Polysiphonia sp. TaxID=1967842 RepID=A0A1Z1MUK7_9FLOR|nr:hypothetical protein [Polysiphonia sp.]